MAKMRFCVLLLTVTSALAWPVAWQGEEQFCPPMSDRLFESGSSYLLKYDARVSSLIQGTSHEISNLNVDCDVLIEAQSDCMLVLKAQKCNLKNDADRLPNSKQFSKDMSRYDVVMKMDNGRLAEMYAHEDEPLYILNIKRGIISTLQHDLSEQAIVTETTVNGNCTSKRVVIDRSKSGRIQEVSVSTDLSNCTRPQQKAVPLSPTSLFTNVQIADKFINSTRVCSYELREDNIKKVTCRESHVMNPFSYDGERGVMAFIEQELKFKETGKMNAVLKIKDNMVKKNLTFEFEEQQESAVETNDRTSAILDQLVSGSLEEIQFDSARLFGDFVVNLRTLTYPTLKELINRFRSGENELAKSYMNDALLQCGSIPCFKIMNDMIIDETIPAPFSDAVMYIMAFRQYPPLTLIEESLRIAQTHKKQAVLLPLSIMVQNYYLQQEEELEVARRLPEPLKETIRLVRDMLGNDCSVPSQIEGEERIELNRRILLALKSIGNMGEAVQKFDIDEMYTSEQIVPRLQACIARKDLHHNMSMAAIQAFRRFNIPSSDEKRVRSSLKDVLGDSSRSAHARIAAYLMIMRSHPSEYDLRSIVDIMLDEPLMQVKAFVFSHIENVLESEEPLVQELKRKFVAALGNRQLPEYPKDPLRYSQNIEKSKAFTIPYLNKTMATQIESNIIFNPEHYLPHHMMLNTTLTVLGQSWNLFETGVEMQGFEPALEAVFGPRGFYPDDILGSLFKDMDTKILSQIWDTYRFLLEEAKVQVEELRNTPWAQWDDVLIAKMKEVKQAVLEKFNLTKTSKPTAESPMVQHMNEVLRQALPAEYEDKLNKIHGMIPQALTSPHASVYLKVLGNELGYVSLENIKAIIPKLDFSVENMKTTAKKYAQDMMDNIAQGVEKNITKSFIFLERDFIIPTTTGLPLNCSVNGTTVLSLRMRAALGMEPMTMKAYAAGRIAPSASIEVVGTIGVNVPILGKAAVMANATAYHASHIEGNVTLNGAHLKLNLNNTNKPMNLLNFSTNYFLIKPHGALQYIPGVQMDRVEVQKCVGITQKVLGVDLCVSWAYPNASYADNAPRFPITGPTSFNITLNNTDRALKTYTLEFLYKVMKKGGSPAKKSMSMIAKRKPGQQPAEITDVILVNFTAPGQELRREISSLMTFNRNKYEAKWNISVPELQTYAFAGLLNLKDPKTFTSGFHLVANATSGPNYKASISTTLKNVTTMEKTNYTAVFNASMNELYFANVAQFVKTANNWKASATNYYYWDDETPLYKQILFPVYGYSINHEKYRQNTAVVDFNKQEINEETRIMDARAYLSLFQQNLTATSHINRQMGRYENDIELKFANRATEVPIFFSTISSVNTTIDSSLQKDLKITLKRTRDSVKSLVYDHQIIFSPKELNSTFTLGYETVEKTLKPGFYESAFLSLYGDYAYTTKKVAYNASTTLCLRNETLNVDEPKPVIYMAFLNASIPRPYTQDRISFSVSGRVANESALADNFFSYWTQFNTTVPDLMFKTTTQAAILSSEKDFIIHLNDTTMKMDEQPLLILDTDMVSNTDNGKYLSFRMLNPFYNYTFNMTLNKDEEMGWVFGFNNTHNNSYTDLLNMTQTANMTFSRDAMSLNAMLYHPWVQATMTNVLTPSGAIKRFQPEHVKEFAVEAYDQTKQLNWERLQEMIREVADSIRSSRLDLVNTVRVKTPSVANITMDNSFAVDGTILYNIFEFEVNRTRCGSGLRVNTSAILNEEGLRSGLSYRVKGRLMPEVTGNHTVSVLRVDPSNIGVDVLNEFLFGSRFANLTMNGDFRITRMNRPWRFEAISGGLKHNLSSPLVNSSMDSGLIFDNFVNLTNFNSINSFFTHNATSKWANSSLETGMKFEGFESLFKFDGIKSELNHSFNSTLTNWTTGAEFNLKNVRSLFEFDRLDAGVNYNMTARYSNISAGVVYVMDGFRSPFDFDLVDGRVSHNITSPWSEMTTDGALQLNNFRSLFDFNNIHASGENKMRSCVANWTNDAIVDFTNFRSLFNFDRIYVSAGNRMNMTVANTTNTGRIEVNNVRSLFDFDEVRSSAVHNTTTRWGNWSLGVGMDLIDFVSLFNFEDAVFGAKHDLASPMYNTTTESELSLRRVRSPFNFEKVMAVMEHNTNTSMGNWTTYSGLSLNNFESIFNFRSIDAALGHKIDSRFVNWTTEYSMTLDDFASLTNFKNANSGFATVLNTKWGNMTTNTGIEFDSFRSMMDFNKISTFYHTLINSSILNATHAFTNEISNSQGLFRFGRASSQMATNVTSILGNFELYNGIDLNNFQSLLQFRKINHTLTTNVTARYVNASAFSELMVRNSEGLFNFQKVQHQLQSEIKSRFLNGTMKDDLKLINFASLKKFESASFETFHQLSIPFTRMNLTQVYGIDTMRDILSFEKAIVAIVFEGEGPLGQLNLTHKQDINNMSGLFKMDSTNFSQEANMTARFFNLTAVHTQMTNQMRGIFNFDRVNGSIDYNISTPAGSLKAYASSDLNDFKKMFKFRLVNNTGLFNFTSRYMNLTHNGQLEFNNFQRMLSFDLINGNMTTNFSSPVGKIGTTSAVELNNMNNLFEFDLMRANNTLNVSSSMLNATTVHGLEMNNFRKIFSFDKVNASSRVNVSTPLGVAGNTAEVGFYNFMSLFNFDRINFTNSANASSRFVNATSQTDVEFKDFTSILTFERIIATTANNLSTPIVNTTARTGIEMHRFTSLFSFNRVNASIGAELKSRFINTSSEAAVEFHNSTKLFTFERINATAKANMTTPIVNTTAVGYIGFHNFTSLLVFSRINSTIEANVTTPVANLTTSGSMEMKNMTGFNRYELLNGTTRMNFTSRMINMTSATNMEIRNMTGFARFDRMINNASMNVTSRVANLTIAANSEVNNMTGVYYYDRMHGNVSLNFTSKLTNLTAGTGMEINNMTGIMVFDRIFTNASMNLTSCLVSWNSTANMEVTNMTGFSKFDRIMGNTTLNVTSKIANLTTGTNMLIRNMTGVSKFDLIMGNVSMNFTSKLANLTSQQQVEMTEFASPITFKKINATSKVNISSIIGEATVKTGVEAHNVNTLLTFDRVNGSILALATSPIARMNVDADFGLHNFINLTHFDRAMVNLIWDMDSDYITAAQNSFFTLNRFRGLLSFNDISGRTWMSVNCPMYNTVYRTSLSIDNAFNFVQQVEMFSDLTIIGNRYDLVLRQTADNERILLNATIPARGSLCFETYLNTFGDELTMTVFHQKKNVKTVDLTWLMKLNNTGVIYSNVSWNPETVQAIREFRGEVYVNLMQMARNVSNSTQIYLEKALNETVDIANKTIRLLNYTYNNPREVYMTFREREEVKDLEMKLKDAIQKVKEYYVQLKEDMQDMISRMDFTTVDTTIRSFKNLREVRKFERKAREAFDMYSENFNMKFDETLGKMMEMVEKVNMMSQDPENPINVYLLECLGMTMYDIATEGYDFTTVYGALALEKSQDFSRFALNYTMNVTEWAVNNTKNFTRLAFYQVSNYTVVAYNYTLNVSKWAMEYGMNQSDTLRNLSMDALVYAEYVKDWVVNKTELARNVSRPYIIWVIEYSEPYRVQAIQYAKQLVKDTRKQAVVIFKKSMELSKTGMKMAKAAFKKGKIFAADTTTYLIKISKDPEHIINKKLMMYVTDATLYQVGEDGFYRISNVTDEWYRKAEVKYQEYYAKAEEAYRRYYNKMEEKYREYKVKVEEFALETLDKLETLSKDEDNMVNIYMRQYLEKNLFEVFEMSKAQMISLKETLNTQVRQWVTKVRTQPWEVTKQEIKQFFEEKYEMAREKIQQFVEREDVTVALEKVKESLRWLNQTRFQPIEQTYEEIKLVLQETRELVLVYIEELKQREDVREAIQVVKDFYAREDVTKTVETIKSALMWANQTRFQPLELTVEEVKAYLEEKYITLRDIILEFPVESNVRKMVEIIDVWVVETEAFLINNFKLANETLYQLKDITEENYLKVKDFALEKWRYVKEETPYVQKAEELLEQARDLVNQYREFVEEKIEYTKEYAELVKDTTMATTKEVITYFNGTMAGWFVRYYELDQMPYRAFTRYVEFVYTSQETATYIIRVVIDEIPMVIDNSLMLIDNGLNTVGRVGESSYAMNISHPLAWASFRQTPDLTEEQWRVIMETKDMVEQNIIEPSVIKIKEWLKIANDTQREIRTYIKEVYDANKPIVERRLEELRQKILELKQNISEEYKKLPTLEQLKNFDQLAEKYPILLDIKANLTEMKRKVQERIPTVEELKGNWTELKMTVKEMIPTMEEIKGNWTILKKNIEGNWTVLRVQMEDKYVLWKEYAQGNYTLLKDTITEKYPIWKETTEEFIRNATIKMKEIYELIKTEYPNAREHAMRFIEYLKEKTMELRDEIQTRLPILYEDTKELAREYYEFVKEQYPVYLEKTRATAQEWRDYVKEQYPVYLEKAQELAEEWINFAEERYPTLVQRLRDMLEEIREKIETEYPQYREKIEEGIEKVKEFIEYLKMLRRQIPTDKLLALRYYRPFSSEATAMIFDTLHVLTFDHHLYEHPGYIYPECTYVLATDYVDNNFTLFTNQNNIILSLMGMHIRISANNEVFFNGEEIPHTTPFQTEDKSVTVIHDGPWVNVTSTYGIKLRCNAERFLCTISLSSWYHGKTRGLLGNLDREARTDRIKPNGENATSTIDFVNAYETTGSLQCQISRFNYPEEDVRGCNIQNRNVLEQHCVEYFENVDSPLQPAFEMISPTEWKRECIAHAQECEDICSLTSGYVELARSKDIGIIDPCEQCGDRPVDSVWMENKVVFGADIIFTVSENVLFESKQMMRNLKTLARKLENTLSSGKSPMTNNRYGLAAFGGIDVHEKAHSHTLRGQLINSATHVAEGLESLEFNGTHPTDAFEAIRVASEYKFRPGAAKVIVLIVENEREYEESYLSLTEVQQFLTDRGITLYVVSDYESLQKKSTPGAPVGIQFDKTIISAKKDKYAKITTFLDIPSGNYAKLAIATRGSIFRLDMLLEGNDDLLSMLPKTVRNDAIPIMAGEVDRRCTCVINRYGLASTECQNIRN